MSEITFYHAIPSRGLIVHWMLEEVGAPYRVEQLDMQRKEQREPAYLSVNPLGRVPAIRVDDQVITETVAICTFLAERYPVNGLEIAKDDPLRGPYLRWLFFGPATMEPAVLSAATGMSAEGEYEPFSNLDEIASLLANHLRDREYFLDDRMTTVDVVLGSTIHWALDFMPVLPRLPELEAYWSRLAKRPAWQRVEATLAP
ncbi:MAG: glutathione S-transferase family protein [Planctomycetes bacterium]|nr:glutathione S-transferase family protein [Planctomycetota bacterium]MCB9891253.1 glutathione S-transferase family protein [Planctomycetota bacterium]MCB9919488.1 glutathione S-transferase family protein [Planctomycetota bacterium]